MTTRANRTRFTDIGAAALALCSCMLLCGCASQNVDGCRACSRNMATIIPEGSLTEFAWLSGTWVGEAEDAFTEEHWMTPRGDVILGMNRVSGGAADGFFEVLRIENRPGGVYYLAGPTGRCPPTEFRLIEQSARRAIFENPKHDFPQRIEYKREGDAMIVRISGQQNGRAAESSWTWRKTAQNDEAISPQG